MRAKFIEKKIFFLFFLILFLSFIFSGCSQYQEAKYYIVRKFTSEEEIEKAIDAVNNFFNALIEKDYDTAFNYISSEDKKNNDVEDFKNEFKNVTDIISVEAKWVEIKSNIAVVGIELTDFYDGQEKLYKDIKVSLVKEEDGSWKINFWD